MFPAIRATALFPCCKKGESPADSEEAEKSEEEYKARHDGLVAAREGKIDPGPDSNFSIWSAGGYIFGYDEIDTTMEVEETVEEREQTVEWEMRQLGIMDWITNDVDWMTGDVHADVKRLAWHN